MNGIYIGPAATRKIPLKGDTIQRGIIPINYYPTNVLLSSNGY